MQAESRGELPLAGFSRLALPALAARQLGVGPELLSPQKVHGPAHDYTQRSAQVLYAKEKGPFRDGKSLSSGQYRNRTDDLYHVKVAL